MVSNFGLILAYSARRTAGASLARYRKIFGLTIRLYSLAVNRSIVPVDQGDYPGVHHDRPQLEVVGRRADRVADDLQQLTVEFAALKTLMVRLLRNSSSSCSRGGQTPLVEGRGRCALPGEGSLRQIAMHWVQVLQETGSMDATPSASEIQCSWQILTQEPQAVRFSLLIVTMRQSPCYVLERDIAPTTPTSQAFPITCPIWAEIRTLLATACLITFASNHVSFAQYNILGQKMPARWISCP